MIPAFPLYFAKGATGSGFEVEPFEVELAVFQEFFPLVKGLLRKNEKILSDLSHDVRKSF